MILTILALTSCANISEEQETMESIVASCASNGGEWLPDFNECESLSQAVCEELGGNFNECASACRHSEDPLMPCTMQCILVCEF